MQLIGEIFANILLRKRSDETIRAATQENEKLRQRLERENVYLREQVTLKYRHRRIIGRSKALKKVLSEAERVAETDAPVLLLGETGTGKELLAETIHELERSEGPPMVVVNSAAPATLIESELFGRAAGASRALPPRRLAGLILRMDPHCSWTKLASSQLSYRLSSYAYFRTAVLNDWAVLTR